MYAPIRNQLTSTAAHSPRALTPHNSSFNRSNVQPVLGANPFPEANQRLSSFNRQKGYSVQKTTATTETDRALMERTQTAEIRLAGETSDEALGTIALDTNLSDMTRIQAAWKISSESFKKEALTAIARDKKVFEGRRMLAAGSKIRGSMNDEALRAIALDTTVNLKNRINAALIMDSESKATLKKIVLDNNLSIEDQIKAADAIPLFIPDEILSAFAFNTSLSLWDRIQYAKQMRPGATRDTVLENLALDTGLSAGARLEVALNIKDKTKHDTILLNLTEDESLELFYRIKAAAAIHSDTLKDKALERFAHNPNLAPHFRIQAAGELSEGLKERTLKEFVADTTWNVFDCVNAIRAIDSKELHIKCLKFLFRDDSWMDMVEGPSKRRSIL